MNSRLLARAFFTGALPMLLALVATGWAALERASVDPTIAAGFEGASFPPVWYFPLAVFATAHAAALALTTPGRTSAGLAAATTAIAAGVVFHWLGIPLRVGEILYWIPVVIMVFLAPLLLLLPVVIIFAIAAAGALFGLSIYAPPALAWRLANPEASPDAAGPSRKAFALGGIIVALICVVAFGIPTQAQLMARGSHNFPRMSASEIWFAWAPAIAACCAVIVLAGRKWAAPASLLIGGFAPVALALFAGGPLLSTQVVTAAGGASPLSRYLRDGRPAADAPIHFAGGELRIDRALIRYQMADNPARRVVTVSFRPTAALETLGVRGAVVVNAWSGPDRRKDATDRRGTCSEAGPEDSRIFCRFPYAPDVAFEIDRAHPERSFERRPASAGAECRLIFATLEQHAVSAYIGFDCALAADWPRRADEIAASLASMLTKP